MQDLYPNTWLGLTALTMRSSTTRGPITKVKLLVRAGDPASDWEMQSGARGRDTPALTATALTLLFSLANSSASLPFFLEAEERDTACPSIRSTCLVFLFVSASSLSFTTPAFLCSTVWSLGRGNRSFIPANPARGYVRRLRPGPESPGQPQTPRRRKCRWAAAEHCIMA